MRLNNFREKISHRIRRNILINSGVMTDYDRFFSWEKGNGFKYTRGRARAHLGYDIDLENPKSFNEKLIHRRLFSRDEIWPIVTDKVEVRKWLADRELVGEMKLIPEVSVFDNINHFDSAYVGCPYILKAAWASGYNIFLDGGDKNIEGISRIISSWSSEEYKVERLVWASHHIPRRFIIEKKITGRDGKVPNDYKFFVFNGRARFFQVDFDRFGKHRRQFYDGKGERIFFEFAKKGGEHVLNINPEILSRMIRVAEDIGSFFDFARIDLYEVDGVVYFGEITQTPSLGFGWFNPVEFDFEIGDFWDYRPRA